MTHLLVDRRNGGRALVQPPMDVATDAFASGIPTRPRGPAFPLRSPVLARSWCMYGTTVLRRMYGARTRVLFGESRTLKRLTGTRA